MKPRNKYEKRVVEINATLKEDIAIKDFEWAKRNCIVDMGRADYAYFTIFSNMQVKLYSDSIFPIFFFIVEFQWFLIVLSVLPGKNLHNKLHLLPYFLCIKYNIISSSLDQEVLLTVGHKWLNHLSLHCFPILSGKKDDMYDHFSGPYFSTNNIKFLSSSSVHGPLFDIWFLKIVLFDFFIFWVFFKFEFLKFFKFFGFNVSMSSIIFCFIRRFEYVEIWGGKL